MMEWIASRGRVVVDAKTLMLQDLRRIYNEDPSDLKESANAYLSYIHLSSQIDEDAPYFKSDYLQVKQLAKKQIFGSADYQFMPELDAFLDHAIQEYQEAFEETDRRAQRIFKKKIDDTLRQIDATNLQVKENITRNGVTFSTNFNIIKSMMSEVIPLIDAQEELENRVKKMKKTDLRVRGDRKESILNKRFENEKNKLKGV